MEVGWCCIRSSSTNHYGNPWYWNKLLIHSHTNNNLVYLYTCLFNIFYENTQQFHNHVLLYVDFSQHTSATQTVVHSVCLAGAEKCCKIPLEMHTQNASLHVKRLVNTYKPRFLSQTVKSQVASKRYINWRWHPCLNPDMNAESVGEKNLQRDLRVAQKSINTSRGQGHVWGWRLNHFSIVFFFSDLILYLYIFLLGFITIFFSCILVYFADIILLILCHLNHHQYHHYN